MKTCVRCHQEKPIEAYYPSKRHVCGYLSWCKECESERSKVKNALNRENRLAKAQEWRDKNPEVLKKAIQRWREKNPTKQSEIYKDWAIRNKSKVAEKWMRRDASKKHRTPSWLTEDEKIRIRCYYQVAAMYNREGLDTYHVDHIVPLQGKTVSGLHVPWNLQVLPAKLNQQKSNRF
tara:strand:+ start:204 stop:734 length:531 start_codon:yes stop_codon:yes gene_type:complete